jgi:plasmid stabilization system protein ParE
MDTARYPNYTVGYRPETNPLQIIAILHGKRNIRRIFGQRP